MSTLVSIHDVERSTRFKHVLCATDFSEASDRALTYALAIARSYGADVFVVHAIQPEPREPIPIEPLPKELNLHRLEAEEHMSQLRERAQINNFSHHLLLEQGRAWDVLASIIQREQVDLLVQGTRGRRGLRKLTSGSVAEEVLRLSPCPVFTVGPNVPAADSGALKFNRILFATDFGPASAKAFPYALSLAEDGQSDLVLLHMMPPILTSDLGPAAYGPAAYSPSTYAAAEFTIWQRTMREESVRRLKELLPTSTRLAAEPEFVTGTDILPEGILETAATRGVDLIVMGANRTSLPRVAAHMPWTVIHEVICRAQCPVLTVNE
jgi:nucleotide-binding universal stress UspA family protein